MEQAVRELEQQETHNIAAKLGQHWRLVYEYSECFRQEEYGDVSLTKRLRIFKSIVQLLETLTFLYRGRRYRTSWHEATKAMTAICNMHKWGFRNHNYLHTLLVKTAEGLSAEGLSAAEEQEREHARAAHSHSASSGSWPRGSSAHSPEKMNYTRIKKNTICENLCKSAAKTGGLQ